MFYFKGLIHSYDTCVQMFLELKWPSFHLSILHHLLKNKKQKPCINFEVTLLTPDPIFWTSSSALGRTTGKEVWWGSCFSGQLFFMLLLVTLSLNHSTGFTSHWAFFWWLWSVCFQKMTDLPCQILIRNT